MDGAARDIYANFSRVVGAVVRQNLAFYGCLLGCAGCGAAPGCGFNETAAVHDARFRTNAECAAAAQKPTGTVSMRSCLVVPGSGILDGFEKPSSVIGLKLVRTCVTLPCMP